MTITPRKSIRFSFVNVIPGGRITFIGLSYSFYSSLTPMNVIEHSPYRGSVNYVQGVNPSKFTKPVWKSTVRSMGTKGRPRLISK
jgi:hypothetical protein